MEWNVLIQMRPWELDEALYHACHPVGVTQEPDRECFRLNLVRNGRSWSPTERWDDCMSLANEAHITRRNEPVIHGEPDSARLWIYHCYAPDWIDGRGIAVPEVADAQEHRIAICKLVLWRATRLPQSPGATPRITEADMSALRQIQAESDAIGTADDARRQRLGIAEDAARWRYLSQCARAGQHFWELEWTGGDASLPFAQAIDTLIAEQEKHTRA
jgi:hypothetical protein